MRAPRWFLIAAKIAVLWNAIGVVGFLVEVLGTTEGLPATERALIDVTPWWATAAYAVAVFAGLAGSLLMLLRRGAATRMLMISLIAIVIQMGQAIFLSEMVRVRGVASVIMPLVITAIAVFLVILSRAKRSGGFTIVPPSPGNSPTR